MDVEGWIVLIIIGVIALALFGNQLGNLYNNINAQIQAQTQLLKQTQATSQLAPIAKAGQKICSLKVVVKGTLDNPFPRTLQVFLHAEDISTTWFNCSTATGLSFLPLPITPSSNATINQLLSLAAGATGDAVTVQLVLNGDDFTKVDASVQPQMLQKIILPVGVFQTPYGWTLTYVVNSLPDQHYNLSVYAGRPINDLGVGQPLTVNVSP